MIRAIVLRELDETFGFLKVYRWLRKGTWHKYKETVTDGTIEISRYGWIRCIKMSDVSMSFYSKKSVKVENYKKPK